jgi:3-dehydroquinate dehydratase-1
MQLIASVANPSFINEAEEAGADCIELRLDLFPQPVSSEGGEAIRQCHLPIILTVRTIEEGGAFTGTISEWRAFMEPWLPYAVMVDIEQRFCASASLFRDRGLTIIASYHTGQMPARAELTTIESNLRRYGIPKIVVRPGSQDDVISFFTFTFHARQPIITSITGSEFRFARIILPFFGSTMLFSYAGKPTAEGQFPVQEAKQLLASFAR